MNEQLIAELKDVWKELVKLDVRAAHYNFSERGEEELREEVEARRDQLKTRKRFLNVK